MVYSELRLGRIATDALVVAATSFKSTKATATAVKVGPERVASAKPRQDERLFHGLSNQGHIAGLKVAQEVHELDIPAFIRGMVSQNIEGYPSTFSYSVLRDMEAQIEAFMKVGEIQFTGTDISTNLDHPFFNPLVDCHQLGAKGDSIKVGLRKRLGRYARPVGTMDIFTGTLSGGLSELKVHFDENGLLTGSGEGQIGNKRMSFVYRAASWEEIDDYIEKHAAEANRVNAGMIWEYLHPLLLNVEGIDRGQLGFDEKVEELIDLAQGVPHELAQMVRGIGQKAYRPGDISELTATMRALARQYLPAMPATHEIKWRPWYPGNAVMQ